ncbi:MAG: CHRD domain-containing protein [Candidatus Zixiibacteriota bacterium]|nr:MAG: CHRD domain-containing protein [candidate division Zixibacteria bacterium]
MLSGLPKGATVTLMFVVISLLFSSKATAAIHDVNIGTFFFSPTKTVVSPGDTVRWTLTSGTHTTTSDAGSPKHWDSGILSLGESFDVVFAAEDGAGPFPYLCSVHPFSMKDTIFMLLPAERTFFALRLDGSQAASCVGTGSNASGFCVATLNEDSTELSIYAEHTVSDPVGAHIHLGAACVSGPIQFPFASAASPIVETWSLSPSDVANLFAGELYINIHSNAFPGGEIRGQLDIDNSFTYDFALNESQAMACGGTGSAALGQCMIAVSPKSKMATIEITHDVTDPIDGHIHLGEPCASGPVQFPFSSAVSPISEVWTVTADDLISLLREELYVNIHSTEFPSGEIRGQIAQLDFICGDANADEDINLLDVLFLISFIYGDPPGSAPDPLAAGDANGDDSINLLDILYLISFIYGNPPGPEPVCP